VPAELYEPHEVKIYLRQAQITWLVRRDGTKQRRHIPDACRGATLELDRARGREVSDLLCKQWSPSLRGHCYHDDHDDG
jgi:hypothetical protein